MKAEAATDPREEAVDGGDEGEDGQDVTPISRFHVRTGRDSHMRRYEGKGGTHKIWPATIKPKSAPCENACSMFAGGFFSTPLSTTTLPLVNGSSNSGYLNLLIAIEAGIDMTEEVMSEVGETPRLM